MKGTNSAEKRSKKVYVFVGVIEGVVETVEVFHTLKEAEDTFRQYTGKTYRYLARRLKANPDLEPAYILGEKLDECKIFEAILRE